LLYPKFETFIINSQHKCVMFE